MIGRLSWQRQPAAEIRLPTWPLMHLVHVVYCYAVISHVMCRMTSKSIVFRIYRSTDRCKCSVVIVCQSLPVTIRTFLKAAVRPSLLCHHTHRWAVHSYTHRCAIHSHRQVCHSFAKTGLCCSFTQTGVSLFTHTGRCVSFTHIWYSALLKPSVLWYC